MANENKARKLREQSRKTVQESLRESGARLESPRKAMSRAKKLSKGLPYPVAPYAGAGLPTLYRWARVQWDELGRYQRLALPVMAWVALRTWEKEQRLKEERWFQIEKLATKQYAGEIYGAFGLRKKRKLFGVIPLPGK